MNVDIPEPEGVVEIALRAGHRIMEVYQRESISWDCKDDGSPVTEADRAAHNLIVTELSLRYAFPVLSEELPVDFDTRRTWSAFWLVDPLDGTKDFLAKNDEFTVNIALIVGSEPVLGVVHIPASGITYYATRKKGAFRRQPGVTTRIFHGGYKEDIICLESRFHSSQQTMLFCQRYNIERLECYGSSIKFCKIAEGSADVYPRYVGSKEWDTAAAHCVLLEAGGRVIDAATGLELSYNKESIHNNFFVAVGQGMEFTL